MGNRKIRNGFLSVFATAVLLVAAAPSFAHVSLKTGNFFLGYEDIKYSGGFEPKIEGTYNSKTPFKGILGHGWGIEYEVHLKVAADGSITVHEYGGGAENRFVPVAFKAAELDAAVEKITAAAKKAGTLAGADQLAKYKLKLKSDVFFRNDEWERLKTAKLLEGRQLAVGTQLQSIKFSYQYITKVADGYVRNFDNGRIEKFSEAGKLVRVSDKNKNFIDFTYGKTGRLEKLIDNFNRKMLFFYSTAGLLERIEGESKKTVSYKYNSLGELIERKDSEGNVYTYKYSSDQRHNLVEVGYSDKTSMKITYYGLDKYENVKSVKDRDGTTTGYNYETDPADKNHTKVGYVVKDVGGKAISSSKYEYFVKTKADGEEWTYKMISDIDGERTETTYNECCGLPLVIRRGSEESTFEYDVKGRVTKKTTPTDVTELTYHQRVGKVTKVVNYSKEAKQKAQWSAFEYDDRANLTFAKNSEGKGVKLFYDSSGKIKSLVDQNRKRLDFKYNEQSKPVEITDPALGTVKVTYTNAGEVQKVDSTGGRKIAMQVTSAFQNLLEIIRPAGVSLSF